MYADWLLAQADPELQANGRRIAIASARTPRSSVDLDEEYVRLVAAALGPHRALFADGADLDWRRGMVFRAAVHRAAALPYVLALPAARFMTTLELSRADHDQLAELETAPYLPPLRRLVLAGERLGNVDAIRARLPYLTALERRP